VVGVKPVAMNLDPPQILIRIAPGDRKSPAATNRRIIS